MNRYPWLDEYLLQKPDAVKDYKAEWDWFRYLIDGKQFAAVCTPDGTHALYAGQTIILLKCDPQLAELFRAQYPDVTPGFYSNKVHWNSVRLDGDVPEDVLRGMCDQSYTLVVRGLPKKRRDALLSLLETDA